MNHDFINKEFRKDMGEALWQARRNKKLRLSSVAAALGCPENNIDLLEMGRKFDYGLFRKLAKHYKVDIKIVLE